MKKEEYCEYKIIIDGRILKKYKSEIKRLNQELEDAKKEKEQLVEKFKEDCTVKVVFCDGNGISTEFHSNEEAMLQLQGRVLIAEKNVDIAINQNNKMITETQLFDALPWYKKMFFKFDK